MNGLLQSRKFWITVTDVLMSTITYFAVKYGDPSLADDIKFIIAAWQPVILALIAGIAIEDAGAKAGQKPPQ